MKVAYFADFLDTTEKEAHRLTGIKQCTDASHVMAILSGDYLPSGYPTKEPWEARKQKAFDCGADEVLNMPMYSCISSIGIFGFSAARILDSNRMVDALVLETDGADYDTLLQIVYILIKNERSFQARLTAYKKKGLSFYQAQAKAIGEQMKDGERIMLSRKNILAVECIMSLKIMYSRIKCICIEAVHKELDIQSVENAFSKELQEKLVQLSEEELSDIYGGYESLSKRIINCREKYENFDQFAEALAGTDNDIEDMRKYLIRVQLGIKKTGILSWRLHDFTEGYSLWTKTMKNSNESYGEKR